MGWEILDHTADMGIRVHAPDLPSLYREGALALVHVTGAESRGNAEVLELSARGIDRVDLLVRWLQEVLYLIMVKDVRIRDIEIAHLTETEVSARLQIEHRNTRLTQEIKAVTYHHLDIVHKEGSYEASIIFDL